MDQSLLIIKTIIKPILKSVFVKDKILLVLRVNVTVIFNPRMFHNLHMISKSFLWNNCCPTIKVNITLVYKPRLFYSIQFNSILFAIKVLRFKVLIEKVIAK